VISGIRPGSRIPKFLRMIATVHQRLPSYRDENWKVEVHLLLRAHLFSVIVGVQRIKSKESQNLSTSFALPCSNPRVDKLVRIRSGSLETKLGCSNLETKDDLKTIKSLYLMLACEI